MALTKEQKKKVLDELKEVLSRQKVVLLVGIAGLKVKEISQLRKELKGAEGKLKVIKKTLVEIAFKESELDFEKGKYKEELGLVFGFKDEITPAKIVYKFSQENENLKILGGYLEGSFREAEEIVTLAQLPSYEELLAKLVGSLASPLSGLANVLQGNIKGLIISLNALSKSKS